MTEFDSLSLLVLNPSVERGGILDEKQRTDNRALRNITRKNILTGEKSLSHGSLAYLCSQASFSLFVIRCIRSSFDRHRGGKTPPKVPHYVVGGLPQP